MPIVIHGVHPVRAAEPCHLIEVELVNLPSEIDWSSVTQEAPAQPQQNWQVPYDERLLDDKGKRWAFFFHYIDFSKPLLTPEGPVPLLDPSPLPRHLEQIDYIEP